MNILGISLSALLCALSCLAIYGLSQLAIALTVTSMSVLGVLFCFGFVLFSLLALFFGLATLLGIVFFKDKTL